ncbi:5100_t:CDS:1, partial [Scutellospora calospora]
DYKMKLDSLFKKKLNIIKDEHDLAYLETLNKDSLWDIITISIIKCARSTLLGKKSTVGKPVPEKEKKREILKKT